MNPLHYIQNSSTLGIIMHDLQFLLGSIALTLKEPKPALGAACPASPEAETIPGVSWLKLGLHCK
jgi:hypothetical protein